MTNRRPAGTVGAVAAVVLAAVAAPALAQDDALAALSPDERAAWESLRAATILPTIRFLASDGLEGREAGKRGLEIANDYLVSRLQAAGLEPGSKSGFEQPFDLRWRVLHPSVELVLERSGVGGTARRSWQVRRDFLPLSFSEEGEVDAPVVFAGYGIEAPEHRWDDYAALGTAGARGRVVLVLRHEPDEEGEKGTGFFEGREMTLHASLRQKARVAAAHGAAGLILVDDPLHHETGGEPFRPSASWRTLSEEEAALPKDGAAWRRGRPDTRDAQRPLGVVAAHASQEILRWLDPRRDWKALQQQLDAGRPARASFPGVTARLVHRWDAAYGRTANVLAVVRGSDPELAKEYVLVGGHHDHLGMDEDGGEIHDGADDNASGTATVLAVAEAMASLPTPPRRSLIFAFWAAEEKGLLGSDWFVHHPPMELGAIVAAINLDMVGRNEPDEMSVVGRTETPDLVALFDRFAPATGLSLNDDAGAGASRSDNASLWLAGIPTASLFSGTHEDYHEPSDTAGKIVASKVEAAARLTFLVANEIAQGRATPAALAVPDGPWEPVAPEARRRQPDARQEPTRVAAGKGPAARKAAANREAEP